MDQRQRIGNASNAHQGDWKRTLAVCSAGLLRSPTIAHTLAGAPYNCNTRSAGTVSSYALNLIDVPLLVWAQEVVCADTEHFDIVCSMYQNNIMLSGKRVVVVDLKLPDVFEYRNPELVRLIEERYVADETWEDAWRQNW